MDYHTTACYLSFALPTANANFPQTMNNAYFMSSHHQPHALIKNPASAHGHGNIALPRKNPNFRQNRPYSLSSPPRAAAYSECLPLPPSKWYILYGQICRPTTSHQTRDLGSRWNPPQCKPVHYRKTIPPTLLRFTNHPEIHPYAPGLLITPISTTNPR